MALPVLPYISFLQGFAFFSFNIVFFMTILRQSLSLVLMTGVCIRNPADKKNPWARGHVAYIVVLLVLVIIWRRGKCSRRDTCHSGGAMRRCSAANVSVNCFS